MNRSPKSRQRARIVRELDGLVRQLVFARDGYKCTRCGKDGVLHAAHLLPKGRYPRLRFELLNVISLCPADHLYWAHRDPIGFMQWLDSKYPERQEQLAVLNAVARKLDYKELKAGLSLEVAQLKELQ